MNDGAELVVDPSNGWFDFLWAVFVTAATICGLLLLLMGTTFLMAAIYHYIQEVWRNG